jgi:hypothetical protein
MQCFTENIISQKLLKMVTLYNTFLILGLPPLPEYLQKPQRPHPQREALGPSYMMESENIFWLGMISRSSCTRKPTEMDVWTVIGKSGTP